MKTNSRYINKTMNMKTLFAALFISLSIITAAQNIKLNWKEHLQMGDELFARRSYYNAIEHYKSVLSAKPDNLKALFQLGELHRLIRDYYAAEKYYGQVVDKDMQYKYPTAIFYYALMMKMNRNYTGAAAMFDKFLNLEDKIKTDKSLKDLAAREKQGCALDSLLVDTGDFKFVHLGNEVNSVFTEQAPFPISDKEILFSSLRSTHPIKILDTFTYQPLTGEFARIYKARKTGENEWGNVEMLPENINVYMTHTGNGTFSPDGKLFFYTQCKNDSKMNVVCRICVSKYNNGVWQDPIPLPESINDPSSTNTHPTVVVDNTGSTFLYFSSNRQPSEGGMDIWISRFDRDLNFGAPYNAGKTINTPQDEITPFFDAATKTLYFSSNGHVNLGGFDIFKTKQVALEWQQPENMGKPFNSSCDDMYYTVHPSQRLGLLVSNRPGTYSLKSETCCDDIFGFSTKKKVKYYGHCYDKEDTVKKAPIPGVTITVYVKNKQTGEYEPVKQIVTDSVSSKFELPLREEDDYKIVASKDKYFSDQIFITSDQIKKAESNELPIFFKLEKLVKGKTYRLNNVYYAYKSAELTPASKLVLDTLFMLLEFNPRVIIELSSHTDSRGSDEYNEKLSQARAESCVNYLISKGIKPERLVAKGYGEKKLLNKCADNVPCKEEEHAINRRTEFQVIGETEEGTVIIDKKKQAEFEKD
jgi:outer membrane protein OmpA-like peptidoglycan-associated protein